MTYSRRDPEPDFVTALRLLAGAPQKLAALITHRVPLADVERGFALAADKGQGAIKVSITAGAS
jgi:threonine dehydrogenase-like Zn-dependent dehydrogenase